MTQRVVTHSPEPGARDKSVRQKKAIKIQK